CQPFEANFGAGNPLLSTSNNEYGFYGQDKWEVNNKLSVNLGLRWDYETNMLDRSHVTPAYIVNALKGKSFNINGMTIQIPDSYFSTGTERKPFRNEWQPRLGFSYDLNGDSKSVVFGGWGRYYDRLFLNSTLDERFRTQFPTYRIEFAAPGAPCGGAGQPLCWNPSYLSAAGLQQLVASGATNPEIYLDNNNIKPPFSNQWNLGFRQTMGSWVGSVSYNAVHSYRQLTYSFASGFCCNIFLVPGIGDEIISDPSGGKRTWYDAESVTLDRPYTSATHWGLHFVYTHARALQTGNDLFSLDAPSSSFYAKHPVAGSEPNHFTANAIVGLPANLMFSTNVTMGTGPATPVFDFTQGFDLAGRQATGVINRAVYPGNACAGCPSGKFLGFGFRDVDFRLTWGVPFARARNVQLIGEVFNAFNWTNYGCLSSFLGPGDPQSNAGNPGCVVSLGRREQLGIKVNF
ncbi:MAG TPA: TonB-dependent receptor, partial [Thermoanaerobaculia bacterium]|nr:TonB-dependent receptor [Thermoanaerobaculia bacterium]